MAVKLFSLLNPFSLSRFPAGRVIQIFDKRFSFMGTNLHSKQFNINICSTGYFDTFRSERCGILVSIWDILITIFYILGITMLYSNRQTLRI